MAYVALPEVVGNADSNGAASVGDDGSGTDQQYLWREGQSDVVPAGDDPTEETVEDEWETHVDVETGESFYYNASTGETRWKEESVREEHAADEENKEEWEEHEDAQTGKKFYYNKRTRKSLWAEDHGDVSSEDVLDEEWEEHEDEQSGKKFLYNKRTRKSVWQADDAVGDTEGGEQEQWEEHEDAETGKRYFYNKYSRKSVWGDGDDDDDPTCGEEAAEEWEEHEDAETGKVFLYNKITRRSVWQAAPESIAGMDAKCGDEDMEDETRENKIHPEGQPAQDPESVNCFPKESMAPGSGDVAVEIAKRPARSSRLAKHQTHQAGEQHLQFSVITWNVGNAIPAQTDIEQLLIPSEGLPVPDVVVVGLQECKYATKGRKSGIDHVAHESGFNARDHFLGLCFVVLGEMWNSDFYCGDSTPDEEHVHLVASQQLMEMRLYVFCRSSQERLINSIEKGKEATGLGHIVGNKGGLAIKFNICGTSMCFISCHLAAHDGQLQSRVSNIHEILSGVNLGDAMLDITSQFDHVFLLGDLNFRVDLTYLSDRKFKDNAEHVQAVLDLVEKSEWETLYSADQLHRTQMNAHELAGFKEGTYNFAPTFKVRRQEGTEYNPQRIPSYCDRVLWRSLHPFVDDVQQTCLESLVNVSSSDHKPVRSQFTVFTRPKMAFLPLSESRAQHNSWVVEVSGLEGTSLKSWDSNGFSDPYLFIHTVPHELMHGEAAFYTEDQDTYALVRTRGSTVDKHLNQKDAHMEIRQRSSTSSKKVKNDPLVARTTVQGKTLEPKWTGEVFALQTRVTSPADLARCHVVLCCVDWDPIVHDKIGFVTVPLAPAIKDVKNGGMSPFHLPIRLKGAEQYGSNGQRSYISGKIRVVPTSKYFTRLDRDGAGRKDCNLVGSGHGLHSWATISGNVPNDEDAKDVLLARIRKKSFGSGFLSKFSHFKGKGDSALVKETSYRRAATKEAAMCPISPGEKGYNVFQKLVSCLTHIHVAGNPPHYGGILLKKGSGNGLFGNKKWKTRFFVLEQTNSEGILKYFESEEAYHTTGKQTKRAEPIDLTLYAIKDAGLKHEVILHPRDSGSLNLAELRTFQFRAINGDSKKAWMAVLGRWCSLGGWD